MGSTAKKIIGIAIGSAAAWAVAVKPRIWGKPDMSEIRRYDYARRGFFTRDQSIPENSLAALQAAVDRGYGVTMDVRVTKDGIPVLFHDLQVYRMTEKIGTIEERSLEEVKELRLSGTEEQIPTLKEALDLIDARVPVLVELHVKENVEKLCDAVCEVLDRYDGVFAVQSIDPCVLRWFHSERNEYIRGQMIDHNHTSGYGIKNIIWDILTNSLLLNFLTEPDMLVCNTSTRYNPSMWLCRILYRTPRLTWTIRTEEEYAMEKTEGAMVAFEGIEP